jgi:predicted DNA-binding transcriptional regulator YafY
MEVVYEALFHDRQLLGTYNSRSNKPQTDFVINPLGLIFSDPVIYLAATLWDYPDVRLLALHRLESARLLKDGSRRPADFDLDEYLGAAMEFPSEHSEGTLKLSFLMAADVAHHLRESPLSDNQKISKAENDVVRVSATVNDTRQLRWWLLGFGSNVEVLEPLSLREEFVGMVREMHQRYQVRAE